MSHPYIIGELARERQREMLTQAQHQRLARQLHPRSGIARQRGPHWPRLRHALRAAAGWRAAPQA